MPVCGLCSSLPDYLFRFAMSTTSLVCWKCGASLESEPLPLARLATCPVCHADLHVCRLCVFYDPGVADRCREPVAEVVQDKERANFCGYFQPRPGAHASPGSDPGREAKARLAALFGGTPEEETESSASEADRARRRLDDLFGEN
jgi:hypothetical protein